MAIQNYAIIDHVGSLDEMDMRRAYFTVNARAQKDGYVKNKTYFTMKNFCQQKVYNPYSRKPCKGETLDKLKFSVRHNKNPQKVYFICYELNTTAQRELDKWVERQIPTMVYEAATHSFYKVESFEETHQFIDEESRKRRCAEIWGAALGYSFSAPVTRTQQVNNIDCYSARNADERRELIARDVEVTKITSTPEKFLEQNRCIAPMKEINAFWDYYVALYKSNLLADALEPNYVICPHCGRPMNPNNHKDENQRETEFVICTHCETHFDEDVFGTLESNPYYDDSFDDFDDSDEFFDCE